jgi:hypothetical protein
MNIININIKARFYKWSKGVAKLSEPYNVSFT